MTLPGRRMPSERGILGDPLCEHNYPTMAINTDAGHYALRALSAVPCQGTGAP